MPFGYQKPGKFYSTEYETPESKRSTIQDLRTTIYWKPDNITYDNKQKVTFYTADSNTSYSVVIEGITNNNNLIYQANEGLIKVE